MSNKSVITGPAVPGRTGVSLMARLRGHAGSLVTRASLTSIEYTVSDLTSGTSLGNGTLTIADVVFDSLQQNDARWTRDSAARPGSDGAWGLNFLATLPASLFALTELEEEDPLAGSAEGHRIQCDVTFTPVSGEPFRVVFAWRNEPVYG